MIIAAYHWIWWMNAKSHCLVLNIVEYSWLPLNIFDYHQISLIIVEYRWLYLKMCIIVESRWLSLSIVDYCCSMSLHYRFFLLSTNLVPLRTHDRSPGGMVRRTPWKDGTAKTTCQYHRRRTFHRVPRGSHSPRHGQRRLPTTLWPSATHHRMLTVTVLTSIRGDFSSCKLCKQSPPFE